MICPNCGTQNAAGSNFCIACGADLTPTATDDRVRTDSVASPTVHTPPHTSPSVDIPQEYISTPPPPPPPAPVYTPPMYTPPTPNYTAPSTTYTSAVAVRKERSLALILEIGGGLFGLPGIGWLYAGQVTNGAVLLGVMIFINIIGLFVAFATLGGSCLCSIPFNLVVMGVSSYLLYNHTKQHPETFGL